MTEIRIQVSEDFLKKLPQDNEKLEELLKLGLERFEARADQRSSGSIVDETFGLLPVKDHELIEQVLEQIKYGE